MYQMLAVLCAFAFLYSLVGARVERMPVAGPIVFTCFGLLAGPLGAGLLSVPARPEGLRFLAELTLALVLFINAANANLGVLSRNRRIPARLLLVGLPLTILLGFGHGAHLFPALGWVDWALLDTTMAPTDAALGKAVVTNEAVPAPVWEALNVESGLNDGICVPLLLILLAIAAAPGEIGAAVQHHFFLKEIGIGMVAGAVMAAARRRPRRRQRTGHPGNRHDHQPHAAQMSRLQIPGRGIPLRAWQKCRNPVCLTRCTSPWNPPPASETPWATCRSAAWYRVDMPSSGIGWPLRFAIILQFVR
jgi:NhaP-type Na+/H+ or K+/H+ antiporter